MSKGTRVLLPPFAARARGAGRGCMAELPLILAGPIVRRVETTSASFWIATSKPNALVEAAVFDIAAHEMGRANARARAFGAKLHVAVVTVSFQPGGLAPGQAYSYD